MAKTLLTIAGYDPSGGAGVLLDVRVFESLGFCAAAVVTSMTAQNAVRVDKVVPLPAGLVAAQYRSLAAGGSFSGIKVGMLGSLANLRATGRILTANAGTPRVIDPVFKSSSGIALLESRAVPLFLAWIKGKADLLTPNLSEAAALARVPVKTTDNMEAAACAIFRASRVPCLVKGGHLRSKAVDILYDGRKLTAFEHPRLRRNIHGTGCFLSSAILAYLARGLGLETACRRGIERTFGAIGTSVPAGRGRSVFSFGPPR